MKKQISMKLTLNKLTVSDLNNLNEVKGGIITYTKNTFTEPYCSMRYSDCCNLSDYCATIERLNSCQLVCPM